MPGRRHRQAGALLLAVAAAIPAAACMDAPPDTASDDGVDSPVQLLTNPAFEEGTSAWSPDGSIEVMTTDDLGLPQSAAGPLVAVLGGGDDNVDALYQEVAVPPWAGRLEVSGLRCFTTSEGMEAAYDEFWIYVESLDGLVVDDVMEASNRDATGGACEWTEFRITIPDHAGEPIRFVLEAWTDESVSTAFALDGLSLTASP